ncbi:MAG: 2-hydroxychromene-2-carboxylate isomerase [Ancylobacter novellus]|uniref:2-hydroxychromene-2-carboxylate isomerase n=1 Tax=Ancylobacter novellus TaxID=921 RepID=A0A2W5KBK4_ANCNO|nr:MAG: 2-hydroxychromene-2-carboxylate isomerase [Ancylobacter novellus]
MTRRVDVYFTAMSPWAHLGHEPFMAVARKHGLEIGWKPVPLGEVFSETGGLPLAKRPIARRRYRDVELARWAERRGRPLKLRPAHWPFRPDLADRAAIAAIAMGADPADFVGRAMRGVWEEERDLADPAAVAETLAAAGLDPKQVLARAADDDVEASYRDNGAAAVAAGAFGSPSYVLDSEVFWGQDRIDLLDEALTSGRAPYRPLE